MGYWKAIGAVPLSLLLMGSKVVITVPAGGSVESSSGLFACAAGETCTIDVDSRYFGDTFRAIPHQGYHFSGWEERTGATCSGSRNPVCSELDSEEFPGASAFPGHFSSGETMTMRPTFASYQNAQGEPAPRFSINSRHVTRFYDISGNTSDELWRQLGGNANPLPVASEVGRKPFGEANLAYNYSYQPGYADNGSNCRVMSAEIQFRFETVLPQLKNLEQKPDRLRTQWLEFQSVVIGHEADHQKIYRRLVTQLPEALASIDNVPCGQLDQRVSLAVSQAVESMNRASMDYDSLSSHDGDVNPFLQRVGMRDWP
jgi:predicted secreted Zn-dependent protease